MSRRTKANSTLGRISEGPEMTTFAGKFSTMKVDANSPPPSEVDHWEVRPGGMLVQKRDSNSDTNARPSPPPIRLRVKYGSAYHEIRIGPQSTFGDLKKKLTAETGLHPEGQKLLYKAKERDSNAFLDVCGLKDRSKVVLVEDPTGQARRSLELRKNVNIQKATKSLNQIARDVEKLVAQVKALESLLGKGKKVAESDIVGLTEQLMNQLLKLDAVVVEGEVRTQRRIQVKRIQNYVETLDALKVKNEEIDGGWKPQPPQQQKKKGKLQQPQVGESPKWEPYDLLSSTPSTSTINTSTAHPPPTSPVRFNWELF